MVSQLTTPAGAPVGVVHLVAEYLPFARTGGLADAVRSLANWQSSIGLPTLPAAGGTSCDLPERRA